MNQLTSLDTPFEIQLNFEGVLNNLEKRAADPANEAGKRDGALLAEIKKYPELTDGITDEAQIERNTALIQQLLTDFFPPALTQNEIKAINIPYTGLIFNQTERFKSILAAAGPDFSLQIRDFDEKQYYVLSCCIILNGFYHNNLNFTKPLFYEIPTANGIIKYYRILYNVEFMEISPTEKSVMLSPEDIDRLINNYDDLDLWKEKFPKGSWKLKGFAIMTLFDATVENAVSILKEKLLSKSTAGFRQTVESIFQSIYQVSDIRVGFTAYNKEENKFTPDTFGQQLHSYLLHDNCHDEIHNLLCSKSYHNLIDKNSYFAVSDTKRFLETNPENPLAEHFLSQNIHSFILAPIIKNERLFGILEVISSTPKEFNSINANKLDVVMQFLTDTIERHEAELQNEVQAVIQNNYTTIHESVYWKFYNEAQRLVFNLQRKNEYKLKEIVFTDVHPLYGQIDIKGSSDARNLSIQKDLIHQLEVLLYLFKELRKPDHYSKVFIEEEQQIRQYLNELSSPLRASTEQYINVYLDWTIHSDLRKITDPELLPHINGYFRETIKSHGSFHNNRRKYDITITTINEKMANIIDMRQPEAQSIFPHYYERFKSDGIDHNLYIGTSVSPKKKFSIDHLYELRFWQLRVLCEMERAHCIFKNELPYPLDMTTLILVYHSTIDIRFRMDEKRFDVDGSYNTRFEIVKKRIDKACIKGTNERLTQPNLLAIVYYIEQEKREYIGYIKVLQSMNILHNEIEKLEIEDLQGISGLKALRVQINHEDL